LSNILKKNVERNPVQAGMPKKSTHVAKNITFGQQNDSKTGKKFKQLGGGLALCVELAVITFQGADKFLIS